MNLKLLTGFILITLLIPAVYAFDTSTFDTRHSTFDTRHSTFDTRHSTPRYINRSAIYLDGDTDINWSYFPGIGTSDNPKIIEGFSINAEGEVGIKILYTKKYVIIRNNLIYGGSDKWESAAISLTNVINAKITGNLIQDNKWAGIHLYSTNYSEITGNTFLRNPTAIYMDYTSGNKITNNLINDSAGFGIYISSSKGNTITGNRITNSLYGIYLSLSEDNLITTNIIRSGNVGIYSIQSNRNRIVNQNILENNSYGIYITFSYNNYILGNTIRNNLYEGLWIDQWSNGNMIYANNFWFNMKSPPGEGSKTDKMVIRPGVPSEPLNLVGSSDSSGTLQVTLSWKAPLYDSGSPVTNYLIYRNSTFYAIIGTNTSYTDYNVSNTVTYFYEVTAQNAIGESLRSNMVSVSVGMPPDVPKEPQNLKGKPGNKKVTLTWLAPIGDGGSPIINYRIFRGNSLYAQVGTNTTFVDYNVDNGVTYIYYVVAVNNVGAGSPSNIVSVVPGLTGEPLNFKVIPGNNRVTLTWNAPLAEDWYPVVAYRIYRDDLFLAEIETNTSFVDNNVLNGITYAYQVSAVNGVFQACDQGTNIWNYEFYIGNFWHGWTTPDKDNNGIIDNPYTISCGSNKDIYPLKSQFSSQILFATYVRFTEVMKGETSSEIFVQVMDFISVVPNATVTYKTNYTNITFMPSSSLTDSNGETQTTIKVPGVSSKVKFRVTIEIKKSGYISGTSFIEIEVIPSYKVTGRIFNIKTQTPIPNATIKLSNGLYTKTDRYGNYEFDNLSIGNYLAMVEADGYISAHKDFKIENGGITLDIGLTPEEQNPVVENQVRYVLIQMGIIGGIILFFIGVNSIIKKRKK